MDPPQQQYHIGYGSHPGIHASGINAITGIHASGINAIS